MLVLYEDIIVLASIFDCHGIKTLIIEVISIEGVAHSPRDQGAQTELHYKRNTTHVQQFTLPVVVDTCQEGLVHEKVPEDPEPGHCSRKRLLSF